MTVSTMTIDQLRLSPLNVRRNQEDANETTALEASIESFGLLFPLVVHPMRGGGGKFGVLAGGRRYRAITRLIERGALPRDWSIDVVVRDLSDRDITELSLAENLLRRELRPYEVFAAISRAIVKGATPHEIAARFGQRVEWVLRGQRLGNLARPIFEALADGKISIEQAMAYAATDDRDLQLTIWNSFADAPAYQHHPGAIRGRLKVGDRELDKLLRFVGDAAYRRAGGRFELDLFADGSEARGRVTDEGLLRKLAEEKLSAERQAIRKRVPGRDVRFADPPAGDYGVTDWALQVQPVFRPLDGFDQAHLDDLHAQIDVLEDQRLTLIDEDDKPLIGSEDSIAAIDAELAAKFEASQALLDQRQILLPEGDVIASIAIDDSGEAVVSFWWASRKAKHAAERGKASPASLGPIAKPMTAREGEALRDPAHYAKSAREIARDEFGAGADAIEVMRSLRREVLRQLLVDNASKGGSRALRYLIWSQLRLRLAHNYVADIGLHQIGSPAYPPVAVGERIVPHLQDSQAHAEWQASVERIAKMPFVTNPDLPAALIDFMRAPKELVDECAAVVVGLSLERSANVDGYRCRVHDTLAQLSDANAISARKMVAPTEAMLNLFAKADRLALIEPYVDQATYRKWQSASSAEVTANVLRVLLDRPMAADWVHPMLRFDARKSHDRAPAPVAEPVMSGVEEAA